jgi:hypothetical protein
MVADPRVEPVAQGVKLGDHSATSLRRYIADAKKISKGRR